jgi:protein-disulfide isomerase
VASPRSFRPGPDSPGAPDAPDALDAPGAPVRGTGRRSHLLRWAFLLAALVGLGGGALFGTYHSGAGRGDAEAVRSAEAARRDARAASARAARVDSALASAGGVEIGLEDAPLTLYEVLDYECSACAVVSRRLFPALKTRYVDSGLVRVVFVDYPLPVHANAEYAARAARCADEQAAFSTFQEALFRTQAEWSGLMEQNRLDAALESLASEQGLSLGSFRRCYHAPATAEEVERSRRAMAELGISGTPAFFLNGVVLPPRGEAITQALDEALAAHYQGLASRAAP